MAEIVDIGQPEQNTTQLFPEADKMPLYWANLTATEKIVINQGGTYSGKSEAIIRVLFTIACIYPNLKIDIVANSVPKLKEDSMAIADRIVKRNIIIQLYLSVPFNKTDREYKFRNGTVIAFKSYETAEAADGAKRDILYINEARRIPWEIARLLILRTNHKVFIDYNPVGRFWAHTKLIECPVKTNKAGLLVKEYPSVKVIRSWHIHNHFIAGDKHEEIENIADPEMWKAYARGLTAQLSGLVYPNWGTVPNDYLTQAKAIIWGIDLGFTNDPTVILKIGVETPDYDFVFDEIPGNYIAGMPAVDMAARMKENGYKFGQPAYQDHKDSLRRELRRLRIVAINAVKGKGSVEAGILYLRSKRCAITERSTNLRTELDSHMFEMEKDGTASNLPEHKSSHGPSAARYGAYTYAIRHRLIKPQVDEEEVAAEEGDIVEDAV